MNDDLPRQLGTFDFPGVGLEGYSYTELARLMSDIIYFVESEKLYTWYEKEYTIKTTL